MDDNSELHNTVEYAGWRKVAISIFVLFHWSCVAAWLIPRFQSNVGGDMPGSAPALAETYLFTTGHWQYWNMFAPPPGQGWDDSSLWIEASVEVSDGSLRRFEFPRPSRPDARMASVQSSFLKYQHRILEPHNKRFRADLAHYLARQVAASGERPVLVSLSYCTIPLPKHDSQHTDQGENFIDYTQLLRHSSAITRRKFFQLNLTVDDSL